ncbi:unnamed protein product [Agarophyton chilense]
MPLAFQSKLGRCNTPSPSFFLNLSHSSASDFIRPAPQPDTLMDSNSVPPTPAELPNKTLGRRLLSPQSCITAKTTANRFAPLTCNFAQLTAQPEISFLTPDQHLKLIKKQQQQLSIVIKMQDSMQKHLDVLFSPTPPHPVSLGHLTSTSSSPTAAVSPPPRRNKVWPANSPHDPYCFGPTSLL